MILKHFHAGSTLLLWLYMSIRVWLNVSFSLVYLLNLEYFATLFQSRVFAITNFFGRFCGVFAPFLSETISNPLLIVSLLCIGAAVALSRLGEPLQGLKKGYKNT